MLYFSTSPAWMDAFLRFVPLHCAVTAGTFNPANKAQGKNPFTLTSKAVDNEKYQALLSNETRYSRLTRAFPDRAKELFARNQQVANDRYEHLTRLVDLYK